MCKCTPEIRTPFCPTCVLPNAEKILPMPPVIKPPMCNLRDFYDVAEQHLGRATFMELVEKALQRIGV